jgi:hypothetical protein
MRHSGQFETMVGNGAPGNVTGEEPPQANGVWRNSLRLSLHSELTTIETAIAGATPFHECISWSGQFEIDFNLRSQLGR